MHEGLVLNERYQLVENLDSGGMGSVWRANDLLLGSEVAIKLMDPRLADSHEALARFRHEAQAAAAIRSTYVVQIFDYGVDGICPFIAMELLRGESLAARLKRVGCLRPAEVGHLLGHVGRALDLAHSKGIVHRDLKPENIYLVREGEEDVGKMLDFGIARSMGGFSSTEGLKTQTGAVLGSPFYMSAEQVSGQAVDQLTDIWSFGIIAYECLLGRRTFEGDSFGALYQAICVTQLPVPSAIGVVPAGFDAWFARTIARDKSARYQSIKQAADDLRALCGTLSDTPPAILGTAGVDESTRPTSATIPAPEDPNAADATSSLEQTAPPSANTIQRLVRRKPVLAAAAIAAIGGLVFVVWHSSPNPRGLPSAQVERSPAAAPAQPEAAKPSAVVTPPKVQVPEVTPVVGATSAPSTLHKAKTESPRLPMPKSSASAAVLPSTKGRNAPPSSRPRRNVSGI